MQEKILYLFIVSTLIYSISGDATASESHLLTGTVMGTTYHIRYISDSSENKHDLQKSVHDTLESVSASMSIHIERSEINGFNNLRDVKKKYTVSDQFLDVLIEAETLYRLTSGSWDGSIGPLVSLWGFGSDPGDFRVPKQEEVNLLLAKTGFDKIIISKAGFITKKNPDVSIDLNSIAKGYGVDKVADLLKHNKINKFIVEVGGEIFASGKKAKDKPWKVGINRPVKTAGINDVYKIVALTDKAMATSGDYRNFYETEGSYFSHIIDPKTGMPIQNGVVSASVIADTCTFADGLATALMVMGEEKGIGLVNRLENTECLIVVRKPDNSLKDFYSKGFLTVE